MRVRVKKDISDEGAGINLGWMAQKCDGSVH